MTQTVSSAIEQRQQAAGPGALIAQYSSDFATVLPSHIKPETWVRLAQGALKKGGRVRNEKDPNHGQFELEVAARNNPGAFLAALLDAARQGLTPGSEEYYLTPRKVGGRLEILGIVGYQGYIELMYRSGAVTSVRCSVVRENDFYQYEDGVTPVPVHRHKPFARDAERGPLIGAFAYARMSTGDISQVIELNRDDIARIKAVNPASGGQYSPWTNWEAEMWLKSAARRLRKWVPTSPEYRRELARAAGEAQRIAERSDAPAGIETPQGDEAFIDGEFEESGEDWPETIEPGGAQ